MGTVIAVDPRKPKHEIHFLWDKGVYGCRLCGPLYAAEGDKDLREPTVRHCHEVGQCGACWGQGSWIFVSSPVCKEPRCSQCGGYGTRDAELDPTKTWTYPRPTASASLAVRRS